MTQSKHDPLTGLAGREAFEQALEACLAQEDSGCLSLVLCDVDNFLQINQNHGRAAGDAVLKTVAAALGGDQAARLFRYGGDEFALLFANLEREQVFLRMERLRAAIQDLQTVDIEGKDLALDFTISAGLAAWPIDGSNQAELFRKADAALYRAKLGGRNRVMLAYEEKMVPKTAHFTLTQLERLAELAKDQGVGEAVLLREAVDALLVKYLHGFNRG